MNIGLFLVILVIVLFLIYYKFMFSAFKAKFAKHFFWIFGVISVAYAMIFTGILDRLFIIFFSIVLVAAKTFLTMIDKS